MRTERDELGERTLDSDCLYGLQSLRARENFGFIGGPVKKDMVRAMLIVKKAAAMSYLQLEKDGSEKAKWEMIVRACDGLLSGEDEDAFITPALQGGAGTSLNMNVDEVVANKALKLMGKQPGSYDVIHPLDDVNRGQSTNDTYPTALKIAAIQKLRLLSDECSRLQESFQRKEQEFSHISKLGRTEMMDATAVTLGEEFGAFGQAIARDRWRIYKVEERLRQVNLGGTAVGSGVNADRRYIYKVIDILRDLTDIGLARAEYPMDITQNQDVFAEASGLLKAMAVNLMKIAGDLRLMASGPFGGLAEIRLPKLQRGSTIMPGKVNPVIPEMVTQAAIRVIANDSAITMAASMGNLELNAFMPLIADSLLDSLDLLIRAAEIFRLKCVDGICANEEKCREYLEKAVQPARTEAARIEGYDRASGLITEDKK
ncbi:MAG: aspartate ammonia-lyase [Enterocloster sp.]